MQTSIEGHSAGDNPRAGRADSFANFSDVQNSGEWIMHVVDEAGETVCRLRFSAEK